MSQDPSSGDRREQSGDGPEHREDGRGRASAPARDRARSPLRAAAARALINRDYALFMAGAFVSATGSWVMAVAVGWLVLELSNSAFVLGLTNFAQMVPLLLLGFPAGAVVDRFDRRMLLLVAQVGTMATIVLLALATALDFASIPLILGLSVVGGLFNALGWPTWSVFIKDLVGPEHLRSAVALNSARFNLTRVFGPALAGVLLAAYGVTVCLVVAAVTALGVIFALLAIRPRPATPAQRQDWLPALLEGLEYAWREPRIRDLLVVTGLLGFLALPYQAFLPAFARDVLGAGPEALGILLTAVGVGAIGGAAFSGSSLVARSPGRAMAALAAGTGVGLVALAASHRIETSTFALAFVGLSSIGYLAIANATLQLSVRDDLVGRVMGLWTVVNAGTTPLGSLAVGAAAERIGLTTALAAVGGACVLVGLAVLRSGQRPARVVRPERTAASPHRGDD